MPSVAQLPVTPPVGPIPHVEITEADLAFIGDMIVPHSEPYIHSHPKSQSWRRRDAPLDPLLFAAAAASGPHVTRHHYHHDFFPTTLGLGDDADCLGERKEEIELPPRYVSKQAPRSQRLGEEKRSNQTARLPSTPPPIHGSATTLKLIVEPKQPIVSFTPPPFDPTNPSVQVQCLSRARIPTPHGPAFLHLYGNNRDGKEHLAIVVDPAQLETQTHLHAPPIRSHTLDATWSPMESDTDRIVRGAYVGRLTSTARIPSSNPQTAPITSEPAAQVTVPAPLVRIHSECFTGETIGSMRCDCGEQLDEALRLISLPLPITGGVVNGIIPGRGVIVYLRQEGRGIGLLSKLRAYNLQDMGHDTVTANLMLGHGADERGYEVAGAILRDLGLDREGVRLLTNNPDKVRALREEGLRIVERIGMVPRSWQCRQHDHPHVDDSTEVHAAGVTLLGAGAAHGEELDKYLQTKVERMGHMLTVPPPSAH